jgi:Ser/Thr protein kinase RdoA (MazF antagonist)
VCIHDLLRDRGVRVPEVVYFEPFHNQLQRSVMVTTAIPGCPLAEDVGGLDISAVLAAAGRDLAAINAVGMTGFGFVRRDLPPSAPVEGEIPTLHAFALGELEQHLAAVSSLLSGDEVEAVQAAVSRHGRWLDTDQACLAHGDLDATHIYHRDGQYSGIIDFGEIRGADRFYDLGHLALHEGEIIPYPILPQILAGYGEVVPLPPDHAPRIQFWSLLIGVRALARSANRPESTYRHYLTQAIRRVLANFTT